MNVTEKVEQFLLKYDLIQKDNTVITGFSGGYDSMCLLDIVIKLSHKYNFIPVAIHLNHNWRGDESRREEEKCKEFCQKKNIEFYSETLPKNVQCTETSAREARYEFFEKCAKKFNSKCILTAHNADDNAETVLYRIIKGTGISGLEGIKEKRDIFYRPLLKIYRKDIELYCFNNNLTPNNDSSNSNTKYKRNLIRHEIFPLFEKINPNFKESINSLSELTRDENTYFESIISLLGNNHSLNTSDYKKLPKAVKTRFIHDLYKNLNLDYDREKIEYIFEFIESNITSKSGKTCSITSDLWLYVSDKIISPVTKAENHFEEIKIDHCGEYIIQNYKFTIKETTSFDKFPNDSENTAIVDLSKFNLNFILRNRKDGDIIQPLGVSGTQKLKKYLNNKKIPNHKKDTLLFLCLNNEVLWAPSIGISDKIKVINNPTHILKLEKINKD